MATGRPLVDVFRIEGFKSALSVRGRRLAFSVPEVGDGYVTGLVSLAPAGGHEFEVGEETAKRATVSFLRDDWDAKLFGEPRPGLVLTDETASVRYRVTAVAHATSDVVIALDCVASTPEGAAFG